MKENNEKFPQPRENVSSKTTVTLKQHICIYLSKTTEPSYLLLDLALFEGLETVKWFIKKYYVRIMSLLKRVNNVHFKMAFFGSFVD